MIATPKLLIASHLALALAAGFIGWKVRDADYQAYLKKVERAAHKATKEVRRVEARNEGISQGNREALGIKQQQVQYVYRTVTKEVPVYVTQTVFEKRVLADGGLPAGLVWSYNQSVSNSTAPLPPGTNPDTPTDLECLPWPAAQPGTLRCAIRGEPNSSSGTSGTMTSKQPGQ